MRKRMNNKVEKNVKSEIDANSITKDAKQLLVITVSVLLVLGCFYLLTVFMLKDDIKENDDIKQEVDVKFDEILIGRSFSLSDDTYYVSNL